LYWVPCGRPSPSWSPPATQVRLDFPFHPIPLTPSPVLLAYRLYCYRREFARLVAARNTTKSRFIRLFVICIVIIAAYVPYTLWLLVVLTRYGLEPYSWDVVHAPERFNSIMFMPAGGVVNLDKWGQVVSGYVLFFVFGTGSDAYNSYKKMGVAMGLGRMWPALYVLRESGAATPNSFISARSWTQSWSSKAKSKFWSRSGSMAEETLVESERHGSVAVVGARQESGREASWFGRVFGRGPQQQTVLPFFVDHRKGSVVEMTDLEHKDVSPGASARVWASESSSGQGSEDGGVRVSREVHLECQKLDDKAKDRKSNEACGV
jgi:pheromone a factor receptor